MIRARPALAALLGFVAMLSVPSLAAAADVEALEDGGFELSECGVGEPGCSNDFWETPGTFFFCSPFECPGRPATGDGWGLAGGFELETFGFTSGSLAQTAPVFTDAGDPVPRTLSFRLRRPRTTDGVTASMSVAVGNDSLAQFNTISSRAGYQDYEYTPPANESGRVSFFYSCENSNSYAVDCPAFLFDDVSLTYDGAVLDIVKAPKKRTTATSARFEFEVEDRGAELSLECRLDRGNFESCVSPRSYSRLKPGRHTFTVRSANPNALPLPVSHSWTVKKKRRG